VEELNKRVASTHQLHHRLRPQATASPPAAPGNRGEEKKKNREADREGAEKGQEEKTRETAEGRKERKTGKPVEREANRNGKNRKNQSMLLPLLPGKLLKLLHCALED